MIASAYPLNECSYLMCMHHSLLYFVIFYLFYASEIVLGTLMLVKFLCFFCGAVKFVKLPYNVFCSIVSFSTQVIYRIKLPGPAILGEGKPENQNHAIIFTRGEGLQTIDMNQVQ